jgi:hypothetical protein
MNNGNGKKDRLDRIEEYLNMAAAQTAENAKQITKTQEQLRKSAAQHDREMKEIRAEHKRGMREIRESLNKLINRIAT